MEKDRLLELEELGSLLYTIKEVGKIMELSDEEEDAINFSKQSPLFKAYWRGFYKTDIELRKQVRQLANAGSSPAQTLLYKMIHETQSKQFLDEHE